MSRFAVALVALVCLTAFAPAPFPRPAKKPPLRPIEIAYAKIRLGMGEKDLSSLMSPFKARPPETVRVLVGRMDKSR